MFQCIALDFCAFLPKSCDKFQINFQFWYRSHQVETYKKEFFAQYCGVYWTFCGHSDINHVQLSLIWKFMHVFYDLSVHNRIYFGILDLPHSEVQQIASEEQNLCQWMPHDHPSLFVRRLCNCNAKLLNYMSLYRLQLRKTNILKWTQIQFW